MAEHDGHEVKCGPDCPARYESLLDLVCDDDDQDMTPGEQVFYELQQAKKALASLTTERDQLREQLEAESRTVGEFGSKNLRLMGEADALRKRINELKETLSAREVSMERAMAERDTAQALLVEEQRDHAVTRELLAEREAQWRLAEERARDLFLACANHRAELGQRERVIEAARAWRAQRNFTYRPGEINPHLLTAHQEDLVLAKAIDALPSSGRSA